VCDVSICEYIILYTEAVVFEDLPGGMGAAFISLSSSNYPIGPHNIINVGDAEYNIYNKRYFTSVVHAYNTRITAAPASASLVAHTLKCRLEFIVYVDGEWELYNIIYSIMYIVGI